MLTAPLLSFNVENYGDRPEAHRQIQAAVNDALTHAPQTQDSCATARCGSTLILRWTALEGIACRVNVRACESRGHISAGLLTSAKWKCASAASIRLLRARYPAESGSILSRR